MPAGWKEDFNTYMFIYMSQINIVKAACTLATATVSFKNKFLLCPQKFSWGKKSEEQANTVSSQNQHESLRQSSVG